MHCSTLSLHTHISAPIRPYWTPFYHRCRLTGPPPHGRLRDEHRMVRLIDKAVQLLEARLPKADDEVVELSTTPHEMCRGYLKQVEHIYYKVDKRIFQQAEVSCRAGGRALVEMWC